MKRRNFIKKAALSSLATIVGADIVFGNMLPSGYELLALQEAYELYTNKHNYCYVGSVKSNIGHLDTASGIAGFIKALLCVNDKKIPKQINLRKPNEKFVIHAITCRSKIH